MNILRMTNTKTYDVVIVGGGIVGVSVGYGLQRKGVRVAILDGGNRDFSATRGNFGLIAVSNKGFDNIPYFRLSLASKNLWRHFADEIKELSGIDPYFEDYGMLYILVGEQEFNDKVIFIKEFMCRAGDSYQHEILNRKELDRLLGRLGLGRGVVGGSFSPLDGCVDPLRLYSGLLRAYQKLGGQYLPGHVAAKIARNKNAFVIKSRNERFSAHKVLIAAGHETLPLASQVGIHVNVRPQRGQVIVTERVERIFKYPVSGLMRQNADGTIIIGGSREESGLNDRTSTETLMMLARRAVERIPILHSLNIHRCWASLRPLTNDGYPVYQESKEQPGAFVTTCHSGITLAAIHAHLIPKWIINSEKSNLLKPFIAGRFKNEAAIQGH